MQLEVSKLQFLMFAVDVVLVAEKEEDTKNVDMLNEVMARWKMKINWEKTEVMIV